MKDGKIFWERNFEISIINDYKMDEYSIINSIIIGIIVTKMKNPVYFIIS